MTTTTEDGITITKVRDGHMFSFWSEPSQRTISYFFLDGKEPAYMRPYLPKDVL